MVAPNDDVIDVLDGGTSLVSQLAHSSALVKSRQGSEILLGDRGCVVGANESVGVGRVADDAHLDSLLGHLIDGATLGLENFGISLKQVRALHAGASWAGTDKHANIGVLEANERINSGNDVLNARVRAILELHDEALEDLLSRRQLDELHDHLLVWSKHPALSNEVAKEGADLSSGASDSDADGRLLLVENHGREVAADGLESAHEDFVLHFVVLGCFQDTFNTNCAIIS